MSPLEKRDTTEGFDPHVPSTPDVVSPSLNALRHDGSLEMGVLSPAIHRLLMNMARIKNVVSSLRLENKDVELEPAREALQAREATDPNEKEVLAFADKYTWIHETPRADLPEISIDLLKSLHDELLQHDPDIPSSALGSLKDQENVIRDLGTGNVRFVPTPPDRVEGELESLQEWLTGVEGSHPPGVVGAIFFAEFQAIHPFQDGNGRIGRLLNTLLLKKLKHKNIALVPLDGRFYATHDKYYEKIASTNDGQTWHVWARYYANQLERAYEIAVRRADLQPLLADQKSEVTRGLLEWVLQGSGDEFKRGDYPNPEGFSGSALTQGLKDLVDQGILKPEGEKRGRTYRLSTEFLEGIYGGLD